MELYQVDLGEAEIRVLRQSLDIIQLNGSDAKFIANLQVKLEQEMAKIAQQIMQPKKK